MGVEETISVSAAKAEEPARRDTKQTTRSQCGRRYLKFIGEKPVTT
jgi:hypothetical protein